MRVLITGVSGYAGFHAAIRFALAGHRVSGLTRDLSRPRLELLRAREVTLVPGEIDDSEDFRDLLARHDVIIHTLLDWRRPIETDRTLFAMLNALPKHAGAGRRFIYTTGCSIFGKVPTQVMDESTEPNPDHVLAFRRGLELEALALDMSVVVLRPGFIYGNDGHNSISVEWFAMGEAGNPIFRGDREKGWSWIHVDDLADAYLRVAQADRSVDGEVFCVAGEDRPRCIDVMRACVQAAGYIGEIPFDVAREGDKASTKFDQNEFISSEKAYRVLGWRATRQNVIEALPAAYESWKAAQRLHGGGRLARV